MSRLDQETADAVRSSLSDVFTSTDLDLSSALEDLGWDAVLAEDPATATTLLFVEQGRALANTCALNDVLLSAVGVKQSASVLMPGADGVGTGTASDADRVRGIIAGPVLRDLLVPVAGDDGIVLVTVLAGPVGPAGPGFDRTSPFTIREVEVPGPVSGIAISEATWKHAIAAGRRALAAELIGVCSAALERAVAYTRTREQYGRPIGTFQAVRHRMSESYAAIESAKDTLRSAWDDTENPDSAACVAKIRAGRTQAEVMRHCVQVFGAIGLTEESDLHTYVTRAAVLDAALGSHLDLAVQQGEALLAGAPVRRVATIKEVPL